MKKYSTDLNDLKWQVIEKIQNDKRQRGHSLRIIWNAIFYITKSGCQWRILPNDYPPWQTVYYHFRNWKRNGLIEQVHDSLAEMTRVKTGKHAQPTVGIIDSQSVKTTSVGGELRGYDAGKKTKGRKRHIVVDTMGLIIFLIVHSADIQDRDGAKLVMDKLKENLINLVKIFADGGYAGKLVEYAAQTYKLLIVPQYYKILPLKNKLKRNNSH